MRDYYRTLGVSRDSSLEDIKKSYKKLAFQYHPDRYTGDSQKFLEIQESYQYLLKNHQPYHRKDEAFTKIFSDMFRTMKKEPIKNHVIRLDISLMEAIDGVDKFLNIKFDIPCTHCTFIIRDRCKECGGIGYIKEEIRGNFSFRDITHQNQTYIFKNYYKNINLHIKINIISNEEFFIKKDTIYTDVPLNIFKAILGGKVKVKTPKSFAIIEIPEGKIKDFSCPLKGKGLRGNDLIINFKLYLPKNLTMQQKEVLNSMLNEK